MADELTRSWSGDGTVPSRRVSRWPGDGLASSRRVLGALAALFRGLGPAQHNRLPMPPAEIDRAAELSLQLLAALGRRQVGSDGARLPSRYDEDRARAFRLVVRSYDHARRAVTYLRWREGDADLLVPSLYSGKRRRGPSADEPGEGEAPIDEPAPGGDDGGA